MLPTNACVNEMRRKMFSGGWCGFGELQTAVSHRPDANRMHLRLFCLMHYYVLCSAWCGAITEEWTLKALPLTFYFDCIALNVPVPLRLHFTILHYPV